MHFHCPAPETQLRTTSPCSLLRAAMRLPPLRGAFFCVLRSYGWLQVTGGATGHTFEGDRKLDTPPPLRSFLRCDQRPPRYPTNPAALAASEKNWRHG